MRPEAARATRKASRQINGWLSPGALGAFALIDEVQKTHDIAGNLFEIGAHHGKSAVVLGRMARPTETIYVCDIFGAQALNASRSGSGDRQVFDANMRRVAPAARVQVYECLSADLSEQDLPSCRFFHIDGGHLAVEAGADLAIAARCVSPGGVIVVDDPYRTTWPGVTEAILGFLRESPAWVTVLAGFNKQVLARRDVAEQYAAVLTSPGVWDYVDRRVYARKITPICGHPAAVFFVPSSRQHLAIRDALARVYWLRDGVAWRVSRGRVSDTC